MDDGENMEIRIQKIQAKFGEELLDQYMSVLTEPGTFQLSAPCHCPGQSHAVASSRL